MLNAVALLAVQNSFVRSSIVFHVTLEVTTMPFQGSLCTNCANRGSLA